MARRKKLNKFELMPHMPEFKTAFKTVEAVHGTNPAGYDYIGSCDEYHHFQIRGDTTPYLISRHDDRNLGETDPSRCMTSDEFDRKADKIVEKKKGV